MNNFVNVPDQLAKEFSDYAVSNFLEDKQAVISNQLNKIINASKSAHSDLVSLCAVRAMIFELYGYESKLYQSVDHVIKQNVRVA